MTESKNTNEEEEEKTARGRKNKYDEFVKPRLEEIVYWCRLGATEEEICGFLGVGTSNFAIYKTEKKELRDALKKGKIPSVAKVAASLFKRANGYEYIEKTKELVIQKDINGDPVIDKRTGAVLRKLEVVREVTKEVIPDTTAQIFYLKNRDPENWKDKHETSISGKFDPIEINYIAPTEPQNQDEVKVEDFIIPDLSGEEDGEA